MAKPNSHAKLGEGGRFAAVVKGLLAEGKSKESAGAIAASIGRRKYGATRMSEMAQKGRKHS